MTWQRKAGKLFQPKRRLCGKTKEKGDELRGSKGPREVKEDKGIEMQAWANFVVLSR